MKWLVLLLVLLSACSTEVRVEVSGILEEYEVGDVLCFKYARSRDAKCAEVGDAGFFDAVLTTGHLPPDTIKIYKNGLEKKVFRFVRGAFDQKHGQYLIDLETNHRLEISNMGIFRYFLNINI
jgi:hypothetical protein